jgi:uncharacterized damage-inducible protein DinB
MQDIEDLLAGLQRSGRILAALVASIPPEKRHSRRGEGFWTIAEHTSHLAQVQPMLLERLQRLRDEDTPEFVPYIPGADEAEPATPPVMEVDAALAQFDDYRTRQVALLARLERAAWRKGGRHPEYEAYSIYILVRHILMHDYWHMYRMEELWLTRRAYLTELH